MTKIKIRIPFNLNFAEEIPANWDSVEVSPVREEGNEVFVCEPQEAMFWGVYVRIEGFATWVADLPTENIANKFANLIRSTKSTVSQLEQEYLSIGYEHSPSSISRDSLAEYPCEKCGSKMNYIGLAKGNSRIDIAHCPNCGNESEF